VVIIAARDEDEGPPMARISPGGGGGGERGVWGRRRGASTADVLDGIGVIGRLGGGGGVLI